MKPEDWQMVAFAIETGLRRSEQFKLKWQQVDLDNRVLALPCRKVRRSRHGHRRPGPVPYCPGGIASTERVVFPVVSTQPLDARSFVSGTLDPIFDEPGSSARHGIVYDIPQRPGALSLARVSTG